MPLPHPSRRTVLSGLAAGAATALLPGARAANRPRDVVLVIIDDLNDWVGVLGGHSQARTPHIDRLAGWGQLFENAHCNAPACNPSRTSLLTGRRPTSTGVYGNDQPLRRGHPDALTLPQHFKAQGYRVLGAGKVFHSGDPGSFDALPEGPCGRPVDGKRARPRRTPANGIPGTGGFDWGPGRARDDAEWSDRQVVDWASARLDEPYEAPLFLSVGISRPHLPWYVPRAYFDLYPLDRIVTPVVPADDLDDVPAAGRRMAHVEDHQRIIKHDAWAAAVQGYLAALSFADAQLGRLLDAIEAQGRRDSTVVALCSDHGWSLGTKFHWKKFALWEECTRIPLIVAAPGRGAPGAASKRAVGLIDLNPTLTDLAGIPPMDQAEGRSLAPLLDAPDGAWDHPVLVTHGRGNHAVRSNDAALIHYEDGSEELYDMANDPRQWRNLAEQPDQRSLRDALAAHLPAAEAPLTPIGKHRCGE